MYYYSLYGHEESYTLISDKKYSKSEFKKMCLEVKPKHKGSLSYYDYGAIKSHLIHKYKFKELTYTAGFFFDSDVE